MAKLHMIGNAHIDPVWLWRWQEGFSEILATFRSALDRMNDFPDFQFTSACAVYYQWIEKVDKEMFEEIKHRVEEGRWNIVGGWFLQPDCNIPDGESFARHGLISQRYFKDKFGVIAKTGYNVDSFGHNANLPQILQKSGMENYTFLRPGPKERALDEECFLWESADGSQVCAQRIPITYNVNIDNIRHVKEIKDMADENGRDTMCFYGVGNHGGGPTIQLIHDFNHLGIPDLVYSTPDEFFASIPKEDLHVLKDELQHHARGCYSVNASVKAKNRRCENNLLAAEKLCVMAKHLAGIEYPKEKLDKAWKNVLFNQFHDIMGGCCIKAAYDDADHLFGEALSITEQEMNYAMQAIARKIDTLCGETLPAYRRDWKFWGHEVLGTPIVVFNPNAWTVRGSIDINTMAKKVTDEKNQEIPFQIIRGDQTNGKDDKYHTLFTAEVEPMGYAVYRIFLEKESEMTFETGLHAEETVLENHCIRAEFSKETGDICRLYDKKAQRYLIDKECKAILLDETDADTWAHKKVYLGELTGAFDTPEFSVTEKGPVRATIRVTTRYNHSVLRREYSLLADSDEIRVKVHVDFHEKHKALKFAFPATDDAVTAKIPYGTISRKKGLGEEPCGSWIASGGLGVANDGKYGYDTTEEEMRLTILRGAIYADHFGERDEFCEYMEQGIHECSYILFPYRDSADAERRAGTLNFGLRHLIGSFHKGSLPERVNCFRCDADHVVVTAVKQAEDGVGEVIRFCEMNGVEGTVSINLFEKNITTEIRHHEIKTFLENGTEVNLIEWT